MILFLKHIDIEGPDTFDKHFNERGYQTRILELQNGDVFPNDLNGLDAVVSLGGPMNVYDEDQYPFLKEEDGFIKRIVQKQIPFMGICLGSQLLAKACGAKIVKSPEKEIGFYPVQINNDDLFDGLNESMNAFHWHEDMSDIPDGAVLLASSSGCPHQAFKVGRCAYGLQFHIEVTKPTVERWIDKYFSKDNEKQMNQKDIIINDFDTNQSDYKKTADTICDNFLKIVNSSNI